MLTGTLVILELHCLQPSNKMFLIFNLIHTFDLLAEGKKKYFLQEIGQQRGSVLINFSKATNVMISA